MNDNEMAAAVERARNCTHAAKYQDENGNMRCRACKAFVRVLASPDSIVGRIAQQLWQVYAAETGRSLPAGLADRMAQAAATDLKITEEHRTLTNGWIQPMFEAMRQKTIRAHELEGLPPPHIPDPEIREESRWVTEWAVTSE